MPKQRTCVIAHTDGACLGNPGRGGWGVVLEYGEHTKTLSGASVERTTNNRMELTAAIEALKALTRPCEVIIQTDSEYVVNGINYYLSGWIRNGFNGIANTDLWKELADLMKVHTVTGRWVKGHSNNQHNILADNLATTAAKGRTKDFKW